MFLVAFVAGFGGLALGGSLVFGLCTFESVRSVLSSRTFGGFEISGLGFVGLGRSCLVIGPVWSLGRFFFDLTPN